MRKRKVATKALPLEMTTPPPLIPTDGPQGLTIQQRLGRLADPTTDPADRERNVIIVGSLIEELLKSEAGEVVYLSIHNRLMLRLYNLEADKETPADRIVGELKGYANILKDFESYVFQKKMVEKAKKDEKIRARDDKALEDELPNEPGHRV